METALPGQAHDAGSEDIARGTSSAAVSAAAAQSRELASDTLGQGSNYGDQLAVPESFGSADVWSGGGMAVNDEPVGGVGEPMSPGASNVWPTAPTSLPGVDSGDVWSGG